MISRLTMSALQTRAFGLARVGGMLSVLAFLTACGGGGGAGSSGGGGGGTSPPTVTLSSISVTPATASVVAGLNLQFVATGNYSDGTTKDLTTTVTWTSSDPNTASIAVASGLATGAKAGTATITATYTNATAGTIAGSDPLTVTPATLVSVMLTPDKPTIGVAKKLPFYAVGTYTDQSKKYLSSGVTWSSADSTIATIDPSTGVVTAGVNTGTTQISASITGVNVGPVTLTVTGVLHAYATNFDSDTVSQYTVGNDGSLTALALSPTETTDHEPFSITLEPTGEYLYVSNWASSTVSQYVIGNDGALTKIGTGSVSTGASPNSVIIDPANRYAYVANFGESTLSQYTIGIGGQLAPMATPKVSSGPNPAVVVVTPDGKFAYAGNFGVFGPTPPAGPSTISQYTVSSVDGSLTPMTGSAATAPSGSGPSAIAIDPSSHWAYVANLGDDNVEQYTINTDGTLSPLLTVAAPTGTVNSGSHPAGIVVDPTGQYVYVANQGAGTISQYTVGIDGALTPMVPSSVSAGGSGTSSVTVDPTGKFVYATNRGGTTISQFSIGVTGALSPLTAPTVQAGTHPTAIVTGY